MDAKEIADRLAVSIVETVEKMAKGMTQRIRAIEIEMDDGVSLTLGAHHLHIMSAPVNAWVSFDFALTPEDGEIVLYRYEKDGGLVSPAIIKCEHIQNIDHLMWEED